MKTSAQSSTNLALFFIEYPVLPKDLTFKKVMSKGAIIAFIENLA